MARLLFLHHNAPAQFRYLAGALVSLGHDVFFVSDYCDTPVPGVKHILTSGPKTSLKMDPSLLSKRFLEILIRLKDISFDAVVSHTGWGCGYYVPFVFPSTIFISYNEWWFTENLSNNPTSGYSDVFFRPPSGRLLQKYYDRNLYVAHELSHASSIVTPTLYQKSLLPECFKTRALVIHEGYNPLVDNMRWTPSDAINVTYASRGLEPIRCFPQFIRAIPVVLERLNNVVFNIVGSDKVHYGTGTKRPTSFKKWSVKYLNQHMPGRDLSKSIRFHGKLPLDQYLDVLSKTHLHTYLTKPFVPSWSLLDAICIGVPILLSNNEATKTVAGKYPATYVNPNSKQSVAEGMITSLQQKHSTETMEAAANAIRNTYATTASVKAWLSLLGFDD